MGKVVDLDSIIDQRVVNPGEFKDKDFYRDLKSQASDGTLEEKNLSAMIELFVLSRFADEILKRTSADIDATDAADAAVKLRRKVRSHIDEKHPDLLTGKSLDEQEALIFNYANIYPSIIAEKLEKDEDGDVTLGQDIEAVIRKNKDEIEGGVIAYHNAHKDSYAELTAVGRLETFMQCVSDTFNWCANHKMATFGILAASAVIGFVFGEFQILESLAPDKVSPGLESYQSGAVAGGVTFIFSAGAAKWATSDSEPEVASKSSFAPG